MKPPITVATDGRVLSFIESFLNVEETCIRYTEKYLLENCNLVEASPRIVLLIQEQLHELIKLFNDEIEPMLFSKEYNDYEDLEFILDEVMLQKIKNYTSLAEKFYTRLIFNPMFDVDLIFLGRRGIVFLREIQRLINEIESNYDYILEELVFYLSIKKFNIIDNNLDSLFCGYRDFLKRKSHVIDSE